MAENENTETEVRVNMNWPADLKEQVRQRVGGRGLTIYTLEAVRQRIAREADVVPSAPKDRELIERLVYMIANLGDYPDVQEMLTSVDLPDYIDQSSFHWKQMAAAIATEAALDAPPVVPPTAPLELAPTLPTELAPEKATAAARDADERGTSVTVAPPTLGVAARFSSSGSALEELMGKAQKLGLVPASELPVPPKPEPVIEVVDPALAAARAALMAAPVPREVSEPEPEPEPAPPAPVVRNLDEIEVDF